MPPVGALRRGRKAEAYRKAIRACESARDAITDALNALKEAHACQTAGPGDSVIGDRLLTIRETCERLTLSRTTVYRLAQAGVLPTVRLTPTRAARTK